MHWFWLGFFALVALLLFLDLGVLHKKDEDQSLKTAAMWTAGWMALGLSFAGFVYLMYENHWLGADLADTPKGTPDGVAAAATYVSAYLLEQALSIDNIFVIALVFKEFRVPRKYQHRILFWGIMGAVFFRVVMLGGGIWLAKKFDFIFYIFGAYLAYQGGKMLFEKEEDDAEEVKTAGLVKFVRKFVRVEDDRTGPFLVRINGRRALTILAICLIQVELTDIVFALDSIPAVLSVSQETFIVVTSNIFAIMGLRSLYFVLAGAMAEFKYLKIALAVLLIGIGAKLALHNHVHVSHTYSLIGIAAILTIGVTASVIEMKRHHVLDKPGSDENPPPAPPADDTSGPGPASPSP
jgi:tellurite resistance protein TerC